MLFFPAFLPSACLRFNQRRRVGACWLFLFISVLLAPSLRLIHHTLHSAASSNPQIQLTVQAEHFDLTATDASDRVGHDVHRHGHALFGAHGANDCLLFDHLLTGQALLMWSYLPLAFAAMVAMSGWLLDLCTKAAPVHFDARGPPIFF